jgi:aminopeptidase N
MAGLLRTLLVPLALLLLPAAAHGLQRLALDVSLDPARRAMAIEATLALPAAPAFEFRLAAGLDPREARIDGRERTIVRVGEADGATRYRIALDTGERGRTLVLRYAGTLAASDAAMDHRATLGRLPPAADATGSFLPAGSHWYPQPAGMFAYEVTVRTPAGQRALVPGTLVAETLRAEGNEARYAFPHPAEGIDLMAGPYEVTERTFRQEDGAPIRLRTWFHASLAGMAPDYLAAAERYLRRYAKEIGPYPYGEFGIVSSPTPTGFGMPTLTYLGIEVLRLPFIKDISLGHEVLHNWWGNGVYIDTRRGNWAEGLTTFMADYAYKEDQGEAAARDARLAWLRDYAALAPGSEQPLAAFGSRTHTASAAVGYGKAAMLFHMLRAEIGRPAFERGIRAFWGGQRFRQASFDDLRESFERAAGRDLAAFFDQWLERTGAPALSVTQARAGKGGRIELELAQSAPPHALAVPLRFLAGGRQHDLTVSLAETRQRYVLDLPYAADAVQVDPEFTLWRRLAANEAPPILREARAAAAPLVVELGSSPEVRAAGGRLIGRFAEGVPRHAEAAALKSADVLAIVIGKREAVADLAKTYGLPARPEGPEAELEVWIRQRAGGAPVMFVSLSGEPAAQAAQLDMLARRLPHLSQYSWLRFEGTRLEGRGSWPGAPPAAAVTRAATSSTETQRHAEDR